jgi:putative heme-binding domain-containing protein
MLRFRMLALAALCATGLGAQDGQKLFEAQCAVCHGARGEGGRGPSLAREKLRNAPDDDALRRVIRRGIPNSGMPGTGFSDTEIGQVASYVRALGRVAGAPLPGNRARGEQVVRGKGGCLRCHTIGGQGGAFGPDLTGIGSRRSAAHLRESLVSPEADTPRGFVLLRAVTRDGRSVTGARVNEDTFSAQLRDPSGTLHSFWKSELREFGAQRGAPAMPSYRQTLTDAELDDITAYLAGLEEAGR